MRAARRSAMRAAWLALPPMLACAGTALAQTCTATAAALNFGNISPVVAAEVNASSTISISCTGFILSNARVCLSIGTGGSGTGYAPRTLANGSSLLNFNLSPSSSMAPTWGTRTATSTSIVQVDIPMLLGAGSATVNVYGRIVAGQTTLRAGIYQSSFGGAHTEMNYAGYALVAPSCTTVTTPVARFPFTVSATVIPDCVITATDLDFGTSGALTAARTGTGTLTARCTNGSNYTIALGAGTSPGASVASRRLQRTGGTEQVAYQLYRDAAYALPWGDGTGGSSTQSGTGTGLSQAYTVYGRVPAQATPVAGTYTDVITVTITY